MASDRPSLTWGERLLVGGLVAWAIGIGMLIVLAVEKGTGACR